jgi:hypothetical protein
LSSRGKVLLVGRARGACAACGQPYGGRMPEDAVGRARCLPTPVAFPVAVSQER